MKEHKTATTSNCKILKEELWGTAMVSWAISRQNQQIWYTAFQHKPSYGHIHITTVTQGT